MRKKRKMEVEGIKSKRNISLSSEMPRAVSAARMNRTERSSSVSRPKTGHSSTLRSNSSFNKQQLRQQAQETVEDTKKEIIKLFEGGILRKLIVPRPEPTLKTIVLTPNEFRNIQQTSHYLTPKQRKFITEEKKKEKNAVEQAVEARKTEMKYFDEIRQKNRKLTDMEEDAKKLSDDLNRRAQVMRTEREEEIKYLNWLTTNVKCQAIRDDQMDEKAQIDNEVKGIRTALDEMMEKERVLAVGKQEEKERKIKETNKKYGDELKKQIYENLDQQQIMKEQKYLEAKRMRDLVRQIQMEDLKDYNKHKAKQRALLTELLVELDDLLARRKWEKERKLIEDLRVLAFTQEKADREEAEERRRKEEQRAQDLEIDRIRMKQERASDVKAEKDEQLARRAQENLERKWRKKELDEAVRLSQNKINLCKALDSQVSLKNSLLAAEKKRDREEFHHILYELVSALEKERKEEMERKNETLKYGRDLKTQMKENEKHRMAVRQAVFKEGVEMYEDEKRRKKQLEETKNEKFEHLKKLNIDNRYLAHINRKVNPTGVAKRELRLE